MEVDIQRVGELFPEWSPSQQIAFADGLRRTIKKRGEIAAATAFEEIARDLEIGHNNRATDQNQAFIAVPVDWLQKGRAA